MKNFIKIAVLFTSIPLALSSCSHLKEHVYCVETSSSIEYVEGECYQVSRNNVTETVYLISIPTNPEADPSEYEYDFLWKKEQKNSYFAFVDGLEGKKMIGVLWISETVLKLNFDSMCTNIDADHGYIKVFHHAYDAYSKRMEDSLLYAYFAIGNTSGMVTKPAQNGTSAE